MVDFILGLLVILGVIILLAMRESGKKWVVFIAWVIIILAKILR